jgi:hypothetical protein
MNSTKLLPPRGMSVTDAAGLFLEVIYLRVHSLSTSIAQFKGLSMEDCFKVFFLSVVFLVYYFGANLIITHHRIQKKNN